MSHQHSRACDEAVHHNHTALLCGLFNHADQGGNFKTTQRCQSVQRLHRLCVQGQDLTQDVGFSVDGRCIQARASARALRNVQPRQTREQKRRSAGIANAHLAQQNHIAGELAHQRAPVL